MKTRILELKRLRRVFRDTLINNPDSTALRNRVDSITLEIVRLTNIELIKVRHGTTN